MIKASCEDMSASAIDWETPRDWHVVQQCAAVMDVTCLEWTGMDRLCGGIASLPTSSTHSTIIVQLLFLPSTSYSAELPNKHIKEP
mmetsp:Transcript_20500/g.37355  ORF Transcript_20500/g.37355 Transcript_20500/m.37355 type:complete len:86 (-) Transcript_20500:414-671(-)